MVAEPFRKSRPRERSARPVRRASLRWSHRVCRCAICSTITFFSSLYQSASCSWNLGGSGRPGSPASFYINQFPRRGLIDARVEKPDDARARSSRGRSPPRPRSKPIPSPSIRSACSNSRPARACRLPAVPLDSLEFPINPERVAPGAAAPDSRRPASAPASMTMTTI